MAKWYNTESDEIVFFVSTYSLFGKIRARTRKKRLIGKKIQKFGKKLKKSYFFFK
jgi:hypothetical protein